MGLFSSSRNNRNDNYQDESLVNRDQYGHTGNHFGNNHNAINDGRPSFSSYDQGNTYGNNNVNTNTTGGHGIFGRDHNARQTDRNNNVSTAGNHGIMNHNGHTGLASNHNTTVRNQGYSQQSDGGAFGHPNTTTNATGHHGVSHHDRNAAVVDPNMNSNHVGHQAASGYNGTSAYSNRGSGRGGWFSWDRNPGKTTSAHSKKGTGTTGGGGWFSRNRSAGVANSSKRSRSHSNRHQREKFDVNSGRYNRRPSFGQWLKFTWLDILTMIILGAIALGVYRAHPAPTRSFAVYFQDGEIVYPQFAYPLRHEIVPIWLAALLASIIPIFIILCMQFRIRSFWDVNNAIIGLLYSLITAAVFQVFLKWLIGGLRPHFLTVCRPIIPNDGTELGNGLKQIYYDRSICSGDRDTIDDSLESFPSGHSTAAFAGFIFLYLYLNAKLKVFSNHHPALWKLVVIYAPVLGATLIAGTPTIDEYHNWYDCLAGAIIGTVMAFSAYRMVYASVWDFRFNHIPLTRHTPFSYGAGEAGAGGFETAVFSHAAGWGFDEAYGGAPFDAAHHLRGPMAGFNQGVHDENYGRHSGNLHSNNNNVTNSHHGATGGGITGHGHHDQNEKTGLFGRHKNTTHSHPNNVDTRDTGVLDAGHRNNNIDTRNGGIVHGGNRHSAVEPTTPTRGGRFHQGTKSFERRPVGGGQTVQGADHMV